MIVSLNNNQQQQQQQLIIQQQQQQQQHLTEQQQQQHLTEQQHHQHHHHLTEQQHLAEQQQQQQHHHQQQHQQQQQHQHHHQLSHQNSNHLINSNLINLNNNHNSDNSFSISSSSQTDLPPTTLLNLPSSQQPPPPPQTNPSPTPPTTAATAPPTTAPPTSTATATTTTTTSSSSNQPVSLTPSTSNITSTSNSTPNNQVKRKFNATLEQKILILDWHHSNGKKQTKTAAHFTSLEGWPTITQPLISNWLKDEEKIRANLKLATPDTKRLRIVRHPDVEKALSIWCNQSIAENFQLGCDLIKLKALEFATSFGLDQADFTKSSTSWIDRFLDRQGSRTIKTHQSEICNQTGIDSERHRIRNILNYYPPQDIWTLDETCLYYLMPPDCSIQSDRWRSDQRLLTFGLCVNSDGSERRPPLIIGKSLSQKAFKSKSSDSLIFDYSFNPKAGLTPEIFIKWMTSWQKELLKQNRKILLLIDNNPAHIVEADLYPNIRVEFISLTMSPFIQPLELGIFRIWKAHYRRLFLERALALCESANANIYQIDQLQAMQLATTAWMNFVTVDPIVCCWRQTQLLIHHPSCSFSNFMRVDMGDKGVTQAESELSKAIDTLVELGLLNSSNRVPVEEYTDPGFERLVTFQKFSDSEIISLIRNEDTNHHLDEDDPSEEHKDEKPSSIPVHTNLNTPINGHSRSQPMHRLPQTQIAHPASIDNSHHPLFATHLSHFQHPSHPSLILHPNHTVHAHPTNLNPGALSYIPNNHTGLQNPNLDPSNTRKSEVWSVPQVLEALEEITRFSMMRRGDNEWKDVPHLMARMARSLRNEMNNPTSAPPPNFTSHAHLQSPLLSTSRVHSQTLTHPNSQSHPLATSHPLSNSNSHSPSQNSSLPQHSISASPSPHPHQQHPHSHPHSQQPPNTRPQSQPPPHSQPSQLHHSHLTSPNPNPNQSQSQHLTHLHQQTLASGPNHHQRPQTAQSTSTNGVSQPTSTRATNLTTLQPCNNSTSNRSNNNNNHHHQIVHPSSSSNPQPLSGTSTLPPTNPPPTNIANTSNSTNNNHSTSHTNNSNHHHSQLSIDAITHPVDINSSASTST